MKIETNPRVEESRQLNATLEELMASVPKVETLPAHVTRQARIEGKGIFPMPERLDDIATDRTIEGGVGLRVFVPETVTGAVLHIHGGGWTFGGNWQQDVLLWDVAQRADVAVVSVEYRLAPEDPYPAGPDDCEQAAVWLVENAMKEFGTSRLLIAGESAGAHLSAVTLLRLRDRHGLREAFDGAVFTFGCFDMSWTPSVRRWGERLLVLSGPVMDWFGNNFLPGMDMEARRDPDISPLFADLSGMPRAQFLVGTADPLLDDSLFMEARWRAAGAPTELHVYEEAAHGFLLFPIAYAQEAKDAIVAFASRTGA